MTVQTKTIGRMPTDHGPYNPSVSYGKKYCVTLYGCMWESLHDNNNTAPAVWDGGDTITPNTVDWKLVSGSTDAWLMNKDKPATTGTTGDYPYNGMGRVVLKKNIVNNVNTLTQAMINTANTIYVIQYDFTLGENITVPANCVLEFDGGSISGAYTITGANTGIIASLMKIFGTDVTLAGTYSISEAYPEWFGAKGDGVTDDRVAIQKAISWWNRSKVVFGNKTYLINSAVDVNGSNVGLRITEAKTVVGVNGNDEGGRGTVILFGTSANFDYGVLLSDRYITIENISFMGTESASTVSTMIKTDEANRFVPYLYMNKVYACFVTDTCFEIESWECVIENCVAKSCQVGFHIHGEYDTDHVCTSEGTSITLHNNYVKGSSKQAYLVEGITYSIITKCYGDWCGIKEPVSDANIRYTFQFSDLNSVTITACGCEHGGKTIQLLNCARVTVTDCRFECDTVSASYYANSPILFSAQDCKNVTILNSCIFSATAGNRSFVDNCTNLRIIGCSFRNYSNGVFEDLKYTSIDRSSNFGLAQFTNDVILNEYTTPPSSFNTLNQIFITDGQIAFTKTSTKCKNAIGQTIGPHVGPSSSLPSDLELLDGSYLYFDRDINRLRVWTGTEWQTLAV